MFVEEGNKRSEAKGAYQSSETYETAGQECNYCANSISEKTAAKIWQMKSLIHYH